MKRSRKAPPKNAKTVKIMPLEFVEFVGLGVVIGTNVVVVVVVIVVVSDLFDQIHL